MITVGSRFFVLTFRLVGWLCLAVAISLAGCGPEKPAPPVEEATEVVVAVQAGDWACPMHPEVRLAQPGTCSVCGMDLVRVDLVEVEAGDVQPDSLDQGRID